MLRALIVDDEELAVERIVMILSELGGVEIGHTSMNPRDAYEYAKSNPVHIAFLDIAMPEINGMRLSSLLLDLQPSLYVVFVTGYDHYAVQAFDLNALDYLMKPVSAQRMLKTLDKARERQEHLLPPQKGKAEEGIPSHDHLTEQETKVLLLIAEGLANKEIAYGLNIASETVKTHIKNVYRKLGVNNRVQALQRGQELRLFQE